MPETSYQTQAKALAQRIIAVMSEESDPTMRLAAVALVVYATVSIAADDTAKNGGAPLPAALADFGKLAEFVARHVIIARETLLGGIPS